MKVLLDTDINLDFILQRHPFCIEAKEIFKRLAKDDFEAYICDITVLNIFYIARKDFDGKQIRAEISKLLQVVNVCEVNHGILESALTSKINDYEDAVQHEAAIAKNLDAIVTRNTRDFTNASLKIYSPNEFLQVI